MGWKNGSVKLKCELKKKYKIKPKGFNTVTEELKQCISTKTLKLKRYKSRVKQYQQNRTFKNNQKALHEELDGKMRQEQVIPDAEDRLNSGVSCGTTQLTMTSAEWIMTVDTDLECFKNQDNINITKEDVSIHLRKNAKLEGTRP